VTQAALDRVLLIGFMGSGKTSVGRRLAEALGWRFADFDRAMEAETGAPVAEIFARHGEPYFRSLEERVGRALLDERQVVLASGGGWAASPGRLASLPPGTASFWLRVSPEEAVRRTRATSRSRPLLARPDALEEAKRLLAWRSPFYMEARWTVDTERSAVEDVTATILEILAREYPEIHATRTTRTK
jgi:shikimate kinase